MQKSIYKLYSTVETDISETRFSRLLAQINDGDYPEICMESPEANAERFQLRKSGSRLTIVKTVGNRDWLPTSQEDILRNQSAPPPELRSQIVGYITDAGAEALRKKELGVWEFASTEH